VRKIEAIIRPERLEPVRLQLEQAGCRGVSVTEIQGHGQQKGIVCQWRGEQYKVDLLPKLKIETVVEDDLVERVLRAIVEGAQTGEIGDGKIFVLPVETAVKIRTGQRGEPAL
jgi:nitrogen regulatory protein P-II 1